MLTNSQFKTLYSYHWHTTQRLIDCATKLSDADYREVPEHGRGSIHDLLVHILRADNGWRLGLETGKQQFPVSDDKFPNLESLQTAFAAEQAAWERLLDGLSDEQIAGNINLTPLRGDARTFAYWRILQHVVLHGMQHHSEIAHILTAKGQSPGDIDFIFYAG